jgi:hypothetical protein
MKLPRRNFLHLAAGAAALPAASRVTWAQAYPTRPWSLVVTRRVQLKRARFRENGFIEGKKTISIMFRG